MSASALPKHIAIIMDGNGRWAERKHRPRIYGHIHGSKRVRDIVRESVKLNLKAITLYAFSTENWKRPTDEIGVLMRLLVKWLKREQRDLMENNIRFRAIGNLDRLPKEVLQVVNETERLSKKNTGLNLTFALSYSARDEILLAAKKLAKKVEQGILSADDLTEEVFASQLSTAEVGDPDLLIRTSGELRISNFLLWQLAYTELYFTELMWPEFTPGHFRAAIENFSTRQRRFGLTSAQIGQKVQANI